MAANLVRYAVGAGAAAAVLVAVLVLIQSGPKPATVGATTSVPSGHAANSTTVQPSSTTSQPTTASTTTSAPTTISAVQANLTGRYIMTFLACEGSACDNPTSHLTYLAQSNDGANWTLVPGFRPYAGSVPDLVRRGGTLYIYNPGTLTTYNISTGAESAPAQVGLKYGNGTSAIFVDPSPILDSNGTIVLFYLPGIMGQDPASCPAGQQSCTKHIMSATEVPGSNGRTFTVDGGFRANISVAGCCASDPAIYEGQSGYVLYVSQGQGVLAFSSSQLHGAYSQIAGLPSGLLVGQGTGGVPEGYYDQASGQYWTYVTYSPMGSAGVISLAVTSGIGSQIPQSAFTTVVSGCAFKALGCSYSVESPGFYQNMPNTTR